MLGIEFIKADSTVYLIECRRGRVVRKGAGLAFFCYAPLSTLVSVPVATADIPFIFSEVTADYQEVTLQGQIVFRVAEPEQLARMLNFTVDAKTQKYLSEDPATFTQRILNQAQVLLKGELQRLTLGEALRSSELLMKNIKAALTASEILRALGLAILDFSILAIKPTPETSRALEAAVREQLFRDADEAIYGRRNAAIEQERMLKENELNTEIAVEVKKRQIRETQVEAERTIMEKEQLLREEDLAGKICLEEKNRTLVRLTAGNAKIEADSKAYALSAVMEEVAKIDPKVVNALASVGMEPSQLIALSFRELAENAARIGELNISPDLLRELSRQGRQ